VGANKFVLNGTIKGDLVVAAAEIVINGTFVRFTPVWQFE
jgi:cytoskeletal protein CcmA (bactofilin family)